MSDQEPTMTLDDVSQRLTPRGVVALTLWGEARGEALEGRAAVAGVMRNRLATPARYRASAATYSAICLAPNQFSCWIPQGGASNHAAVMALAERVAQGLDPGDPVFAECLWIADGVITGALRDRSNSATFYAETSLVRVKPPPWVSRTQLATTIGALSFFRET